MNERFRFTGGLLHYMIMVNVAMLIMVTTAASESSTPAPMSQIPLREGLTIMAAHHNSVGDFEPILTITKVDTKAVIVTLSTDEPSDCPRQLGPFGSLRTIKRRSILRVDLESAHTYWQGFIGCVSEPTLSPGKTGFRVSTSMLHELRTEGRTNLAVQFTSRTVDGVLTRIEPQAVPFTVILNDERVTLAAIHARWHSSVVDQEYWILDDADNPLVLRGLQKGGAFWDVIKLSFPASDMTARLERDLSKQGRTVVYGIYFDFASDRIKEESERVLKEIADVLTKNPTWRLAVEGHTDSVGDEEANLSLSQRRAAAVRKALGDHYKIGPTRLEPTGFGETRPKATNETLDGRALNRRVELVLIDR